MTNEQLRMQMLSGIITEGQYKAKLEENKKPKSKKSLNENFVGMGAINNPFIEREKTGYETAFEHFLGEKYELKEEINEELSDSDAIYDTLMKMDHEELVGALLAASEEEGLSLEDWLNGYDHSNLGENN
jgi:hypothetical protein